MEISIIQASKLLLKGDIVALPTETVYGLAASIKHLKAVEKIFKVKGRPSNNPLIIHLASKKDLHLYVQSLPPYANDLMEAFWPGPMTIILPIIQNAISSTIRAGLPTAAFRIPLLTITQTLLRQTGPLVMPSANISGKPSATCVQHVEADFGKTFPVINGGACANGMESTILAWKNEHWVIARLGAIAPEIFKTVLGYIPEIIGPGSLNQPLCPGQLYRHYAPRANLILTDDIPCFVDTIIGFEDRKYPKGKRLLSLGTSQNPPEAAQRLYAILRQLDDEYIEQTWIDMDIPDRGLWITLKERIYKAAKRENE